MPLFEREGRTKRLTSVGEQLVGYARRILDLNAEAHQAISSAQTTLIRVGLPEYFADEFLPRLLLIYSEKYPNTQVDVRFSRSSKLKEMVDNGDVDCALLLLPGARKSPGDFLRLPVVWLGSSKPIAPSGPLPLVTFDQNCAFRSAMLEALERNGISWRIAYTANSLADMKAAVRASLGITALIVSNDHYGLNPIASLPPLPDVLVTVHHSPGTPPPAVRDFMFTTRALFNTLTESAWQT